MMYQVILLHFISHSPGKHEFISHQGRGRDTELESCSESQRLCLSGTLYAPGGGGGGAAAATGSGAAAAAAAGANQISK